MEWIHGSESLGRKRKGREGEGGKEKGTVSVRAPLTRAGVKIRGRLATLCKPRHVDTRRRVDKRVKERQSKAWK